MASKAVNITIDEAVRTGLISIEKSIIFPTIQYHNARGDLLEWTIEVRLMKEGKYVDINYPLNLVIDSEFTAEIMVNSQQIGGKIRKSVPTYIKNGKNIGKKNETNILTQAFRDALGLYNKQLKKATSEVSKPPPMLIQWINDSKLAVIDDFNNITVQRKYNGVRYVTFLHNGKIIQYSRTGSDYHPAKYLNEELTVLLSRLPKLSIGLYGIETEEELLTYKIGTPYIDGELYLHGRSLSYISGQARKELDKEPLNYYVFDVFFPYAISKNYNMKSVHRQEYLDTLFNSDYKYIKRVENFNVKSFKELNELVDSFVTEGYEGAIVRKNDKEYRYSFNNYHSSNVLKIKPVYSSEFKVIGFTEGKKGKDVGKIIWICEVENPIDPNDFTFTVVPNLSLEQRDKLFKCLSQMVNKKQTRFERDVKGLLLTLEYSEISSKTGKPLQAKAIAFRTYENDIDPIKKVYQECGII